MKTPEEMAGEWADNRCPEQGPEFIVWNMCKEDFLAGYKAAQPQWISVKDRLPEINTSFIGFVENKEVCNCYRYPDHSCDGSPVFYAQSKAGLLICSLESVSHWQPLPESPKEEK